MTESNHFDATTLAAVQQVPTLVVGRCTYRGRLLSIDEWLPWWDEKQALDRALANVSTADGDAEAATHAAVHAMRDLGRFAARYLRVVFPKKRYPFWAPDPVKALMQQPFEIVDQTLRFFFILQARATFGAEAIDAVQPPLPSPLNATTGTDSPSRTADLQTPVGGVA